jgi:rsbT co-antagonist protein RsbR
MRCEKCLLESNEVATLPASELLARLESCDGCQLLGTEPGPQAVIAALSSRLRECTGQARKQANKLRRAEHALGELQQEIVRSDERVAKLEALHAQSTREADQELRQKMEQVERQQAAILALSTPVIEIWNGVLVLPLIGVLDDQRMIQVAERLLLDVKERRATTSILDLTGISTLDAVSAQHLLRVVDAVSLLGARVVLCGLRPDVAQALSGLDVDLRSVRVVRSLKEALLGSVQLSTR